MITSDAGLSVGLQVWRIEKFHVKPWPKDRVGSFYDGDSYIILHTYKKTPEVESFSYDLHFWLGANTSQDEAGTAAYKTVELDDHMQGKPVQFREVQGFESPRFLSYFPRFICLRGGVDTGFQHVAEPPPLDIMKLYRVKLSKVGGGRSHLVVREVPAEASSLIAGDVYVLDKGTKIWQFNTKASAGQEKFKAAEFVQSIVSERQSQCDLTVYDEGGSGAGVFLSEFGEGTTLLHPEATEQVSGAHPTLHKISDSSGEVTFESVSPPTQASLSSADAFILDHSTDMVHPAIYLWLGEHASLTERRLAPQYAQNYLYDKKQKDGRVRVAIPIVKIEEGNESEDFLNALTIYERV
ncbi:fragmin60 [Crucibulum laeve]|uniref:Fragmin60 n=1 Tax=Crucibulum laeve TaxID=68775 RepID=A0A5C3M5T2_9AGAR|nr:fragmin60 [Crucibulum laeve]